MLLLENYKTYNFPHSLIFMPDISECFEKGKIGEFLFTRYLAARADAVKIADVSKNRRYQERGIDIVFYRKNEKESTLITTENSELEQLVHEKVVTHDPNLEGLNRTTFEIKTCSRIHQTNNFFLETASNFEYATPGSFLFSTADFFIYYSTGEDVFYVLPLLATRKWVLDGNFRTRRTGTTKNGIHIYTSSGYIVHKEELLTARLGTYILPNPFNKL